MNSGIVLRDYKASDAYAVEQVTLLAFKQYSMQYENWGELSRRISSVSSSTQNAEIIVAELASEVSGAVGYIAPGESKADFIPPDWAYIRLLVVDPNCRGKGIGRSLVDECLNRARRDSASFIGLHTSPIMDLALAMYTRMGFEEVRTIPDIHGVPYSIYRLNLS